MNMTVYDEDVHLITEIRACAVGLLSLLRTGARKTRFYFHNVQYRPSDKKLGYWLRQHFLYGKRCIPNKIQYNRYETKSPRDS